MRENMVFPLLRLALNITIYKSIIFLQISWFHFLEPNNIWLWCLFCNAKMWGWSPCVHPMLTPPFLSRMLAARLKSINSFFLCSLSWCVWLNSHWMDLVPLWSAFHSVSGISTIINVSLGILLWTMKVQRGGWFPKPAPASGRLPRIILMPTLWSCTIRPSLFLQATEPGEAEVCGRRL